MVDIIFEDNHLVVVNKPFCLPSQGDISGDESLFDQVKHYLKVTYQKPGNVYLALLHRLDRPTGGIMVFAKTSKAAARMSKAFQEKQVQKTYLAITERTPEPTIGKLTHYLRKIGTGQNIIRAYNKDVKGSKKALLEYEVLATQEDRALIKVIPHTGRQHQIRVQLSTLRCPIVGDVKYGKTTFNSDKSICLLAWKIRFEHPVKKEPVEFTIPFPKKAIWSAFEDYATSLTGKL